MPLTIYPSTLKIKDSNGVFHSANCIKGDTGPQGPQGSPIDVQVNGVSVVNSGVASIDISGKADKVIMETVSGTDPVITGVDNHRYMCGTVDTLTLTPPASGTIEVMFTSGSTAAVLSLPGTVKMPDWWGGVEPNRTYDLIITDGVYGVVASWSA